MIKTGKKIYGGDNYPHISYGKRLEEPFLYQVLERPMGSCESDLGFCFCFWISYVSPPHSMCCGQSGAFYPLSGFPYLLSHRATRVRRHPGSLCPRVAVEIANPVIVIWTSSKAVFNSRVQAREVHLWSNSWKSMGRKGAMCDAQAPHWAAVARIISATAGKLLLLVCCLDMIFLFNCLLTASVYSHWSSLCQHWLEKLRWSW